MNVLEKIVEEIESMKNDAYETLKEKSEDTEQAKQRKELEKLYLWADLRSGCRREVCG